MREDEIDDVMESFEELVKQTKHKSDDIRFNAVSHLMYLDDPRAVPVLIGLMSDPASKVRGMAALGLGHLEDAQAKSVLIDHLRKYEDGDVRAVCVQSLGEIGGADEEIIKALDDSDWGVKSMAATVLGKNGKTSAAEKISQLLDDSNWNVRYSASVALLDLGISNAKVVENLSALRDIPEAVEQIATFELYDIFIEACEIYADEIDEFDEDAPAEEILDALRQKHGEKAVPYPAKDPLGNLIAKAKKLIK